MGRRQVIEEITNQLPEHPAVMAWNKLAPSPGEPQSIKVLQSLKESSVFCLAGVGKGKSAVVAKKGKRASLLKESLIYEQVLPYLPMASLQSYGFVADQDEECGWLFLEDAAGVEYSHELQEHRVMLLRWLAFLHTSALRPETAEKLPDRGASYYLERLRRARRRIAENICNSVLTARDTAVLKAILALCDALEARWGVIERICNDMPRTLVHGDLVGKNVRIRGQGAEATTLVFDWEMAGLGIPAIDLNLFADLADGEISDYWSIAAQHWPLVDGEEARRRFTGLGIIFRSLASISWDSHWLAYAWVEKAMWNMRYYLAALSKAVEKTEI